MINFKEENENWEVYTIIRLKLTLILRKEGMRNDALNIVRKMYNIPVETGYNLKYNITVKYDKTTKR